MTGFTKVFIGLLLGALLDLTTANVWAAEAICKFEISTEKTSCSGTLQSEEFSAACPKPGKLSIFSGKKVCGRSLFPSLRWKVIEDEDPIVTVDPAPGRINNDTFSAPVTSDQGYTLRETSITYQREKDQPVQVICDAQEGGPFRCDISTLFASLECVSAPLPTSSLTVVAHGVYKKLGAPDQPFQSGIVTYRLAQLVRQMCIAEQQLRANRESDKDHRLAE